MKRLLFLALACCALPAFSQTPTLTFTVETVNAGGAAVTPRLTWSTSPAASSCVASNGWTGEKAAAGTELLDPINVSTQYRIVCTWAGDQVATLRWTRTTTNTDGSAYTNPAGTRIQYGTSESDLDRSAYLDNPTADTWTSATLEPGTWYFGVRAVNAQGLESDLSNVVSKVLSASATEQRELELVVKFPSPHKDLTVE